jgi:hypothetical protein
MYCSNCGSENDNNNKFCVRCGTRLDSHIVSTVTFPEETKPQTPIALITTSWILFALCIVDQWLDLGVAIILDIGAILCAILLLANKNKTAKINGIVILSIWAVSFIAIVIG